MSLTGVTGYDVVAGDSAPGASVTNFDVPVIFNPSASWWSAYSSAGHIRVTDSTGATEYARKPVIVTESLVYLRVGWAGAQSGVPTFRVYPDGTDDYADGDTYGGDNAFPSHAWARWALEETSGTLYDLTGNGRNMGAVNSPTYAQAGLVGSAVDFQSADNDAIKHDGAPGAYPFTLRGWLKLDDHTVNGDGFFGFYDGDSTDNEYRLMTWNTGQLRYLAGFASMIAGTLSSGTWHHFAAASAADTDHWLSVDGGTRETSSTASTDTISATDRTVGGARYYGGSAIQGIDGLLDELQVDTVELSEAWCNFDRLIVSDPSSYWSNTGWTATGGGGGPSIDQLDRHVTRGVMRGVMRGAA